MTDLSSPIFHNETAARKHLEAIRWPDGPFCPHCGETENVHRMKGKSHQPGMLYCRSCRKKFTVTVGTLFEGSPLPLHKWIMASYLLCASKKGISSHQLHRMLGVTYKTAWFMTHRIREAMRELDPEPMGGSGTDVEIDETYLGRGRETFVTGRGWVPTLKHKQKILTLVERGGRARSFHVPAVNAKTLRPIIMQNVRRDSRIQTDEAAYYRRIGKEFADHQTVKHEIKEYVRGSAGTNIIENYFSIFKRGLTGVYQHVGAQHLKRYICEFDFRYNTRQLEDWQRANIALKGIEGKRLKYERPQTRQVSKTPIHSASVAKLT